jgi:predicted DNA-binding transcriptional regulator AlpA
MSDSATLDDVAELLRQLVAAAKPVATMIDREEFSALLKIGVATFDRLRAAGEVGPVPVKLGGSLRWHRGEVEVWLSRRDHRGELHDVKTWPAIWQTLQS